MDMSQIALNQGLTFLAWATGVDNFKTAVERTFGKTKLISESIFGGIIKGFTTVYSMFAKAKR